MIKKKEKNSFNYIIIFLFCTILLGCSFRFINLGNKIVWHDEALTISRVSGYYAKEINREIFNGQIIPLSTLKKFQERKPNSKDFNIINILATDNPQHPPIYYLLLRFWSNIWGSSPGSFRYLSALFGVLILPLTYWLCRELEQSLLTNLLATVLVAVSPIFVLYAQEAREYSLWIVSILISAIALLRAVKKKNALNWSIYALSCFFGLYIFPFSLFNLLGHSFYILAREKLKITKVIWSFVLALLFAIASFIPWLIIILSQWSESGSMWTEVPASRSSLIKSWGKHIYRIFFLNLSQNTIVYLAILFVLLLTIGYSFWLLIKHNKQDDWLLIVILSICLFLPLAGADFILGGQRSVSSRYLIPSFLGIEIALAFGLNYCFQSSSIIIKRVSQFGLIIIICAGLVSGIINISKNITWNKGESYFLVEAAKIINQAENPLIITNSQGLNFGNILALSHLLKKESNFLLVDGWQKPDYQTNPKIPQKFNNIFLVSVSEEFKELIKKQRNNSLIGNVYYNDQFKLEKVFYN